MKADDTKVDSIITGDKQYIIPVFQRNYLWDDDNWKKIWEDIVSLFDKEAENLNHFIGPFVFISHAAPSAITTHLIIDGQQRLITITLLLCALRDISDKLDLSNLSQAIDRRLSFKDTKGKDIPKIIPRTFDRKTLKSFIFSKPDEIDETSKLSKAYIFFYTQIEELLIENEDIEEYDVLNDLFKIITKHLELVEINLDQNDNPSRIYASLNFEGKKLTDADLVRNYVFMQIDIDNHDEFNSQIWLPFEELFLEDNAVNNNWLEDFYYRYLIYQQGYFTRKTLYTEFTKFIDSKLSSIENLYSNAEELIKDFKRIADYFLRIKRSDDKDQDIKYSLEKFNMLRADTAIPLLISLYNRLENPKANNKINKSVFSEFLLMTEGYLIRRSIMGLRTRGYGLEFAEAIDNSKTIEDLTKFYKSNGWPSDSDIKEELISLRIYEKERKKAKLILSEIERSFKHKEKVVLDDLTLEHIFPQSASNNWVDMWGPIPQEKKETLIQTLGNLTLTGYNEQLTGDLEDKKKIFNESNLEINKYFKEKTTWGEKEIENRTKHLAKKLCQIWRVPK
ncbi:MAG: DUF262 domain-containing HNH endonuclease family protein [Anaerolineales bacterium]|jgi:uncharacterized protein with ParB-like and HNH nuclease domain